ncbi:MAG: hypothetical protein JXP34_08945, partial [Planctomycetes bacterium]|nr:hypothetical protein [Planctomycetota bacterium]
MMPLAAIRLDFLATHTGWIIAGGIVAAFLAAILYARERRIVAPATGGLLLALRLLLVAVIVAGLLKPVIVRTRALGIPPRLIVLEDVSRSMDVAEETFADERLLRIADALGELPGGISACGLDRACRDLPLQADALATLAARVREVRGRAPRPGMVPAGPLREMRDALAVLERRLEALDGASLPDRIERTRLSIASVAKDAAARLERVVSGDARSAALLAMDLSRCAQSMTILAQRTRALADAIDRETASAYRDRLEPAFSRIRKLSRRALAEKLLVADASPLAASASLAPEVALFARDMRSGADPNPGSPSPDRTDLANALEKAAEKAGGEGQTTIILATDGNANAGGDPVLVAERLGRQGIVVHTMAVGSRDAPRDAAVLG